MNKNITVILVIFLCACSPGATFDALPNSKELANQFLKDFPSESHEKLNAYFIDAFWDAMPQETWLKIVPNIHAELGPIEKCELRSWNQTTRAGTSDGGNHVTLVYACEHVKYPSTITFHMLTPLSGGETKIRGFNINSIGFLIE